MAQNSWPPKNGPFFKGNQQYDLRFVKVFLFMFWAATCHKPGSRLGQRWCERQCDRPRGANQFRWGWSNRLMWNWGFVSFMCVCELIVYVYVPIKRILISCWWPYTILFLKGVETTKAHVAIRQPDTPTFPRFCVLDEAIWKVVGPCPTG